MLCGKKGHKLHWEISEILTSSKLELFSKGKTKTFQIELLYCSQRKKIFYTNNGLAPAIVLSYSMLLEE